MTDIPEKYGNWTVLKEWKKLGKGTMVLLKCDCGTEREMTKSQFRNTGTKMCKSCSIKKNHDVPLFKRLCNVRQNGSFNKSKIFLDQV
jgi:hypothetical protein